MCARERKTLPLRGSCSRSSELICTSSPTKIDFVAPGGRIGPDVWPKAILGLAMVTCVYEIVKNLLFGSRGAAT